MNLTDPLRNAPHSHRAGIITCGTYWAFQTLRYEVSAGLPSLMVSTIMNISNGELSESDL
ncbi:hypothetical protein BTUL_0074g00280 [Botrytis tulipae]|uniref:Uncharacterized protein n=1 Tax=Botrytis tulipae TaxID=87230 RepID=A0A4Z1EVR8_9HELO|nr:hypothetical protein BTUL_0074g00280 [Botrytis tulipae]